MHRNRPVLTNKVPTAAATATTTGLPPEHDPFGPDGFGDAWGKSKGSFDSDSNEEVPLFEQAEGSPDWGTTAQERRAKKEEKKKQEKEKRKNFIVTIQARVKMQQAAFEAAAIASADLEQKQAALEQKQAEEAAQAKAKWDAEVHRAEDAVALAQPEQALDIIYSLFSDESFVKKINPQDRRSVAQFYDGLGKHVQLQATFSALFSSETSIESEGDSIINESIITEDSAGGSTVKVNRSSLLEESSNNIGSALSIKTVDSFVDSFADRS